MHRLRIQPIAATGILQHGYMPRLASVLHFLDLPEAELHAARLDGELYLVDECFSPIDEIEQVIHRAQALTLALPAGLIAEQRSAAWVLGALARPPRPHQLCVDIEVRLRPGSLHGITVREVVIGADELLECAGLAVTTPIRTALDIARHSEAFGREDRRVLARLMKLGNFRADHCAALLESRRNLPNKRRALERITSVDAELAAVTEHAAATGLAAVTEREEQQG